MRGAKWCGPQSQPCSDGLLVEAKGGKPLNPETGGWGDAAAGVLLCLEAKRAFELKKALLRSSRQPSMRAGTVLSEKLKNKKQRQRERERGKKKER